MPKVYSKSTIAAPNNSLSNTSTSRPLRVFYCLCGEFILVCENSLKLMAQRHTDNAYAIRCKDSAAGRASMFKLNASSAGQVFIHREAGLELQHRFKCPRCELPVAYQTTPPPAGSGEFLYIVYGALSEHQGTVPPEAFEGEKLPSAKMSRTEVRAE